MGKRRGFTLIELLVVIAIIAVLLAILMPSLNMVRNQARNVVCQSNLKQWSLCLNLYLNDYEGHFMPGIDEDWATGQYSWIYTLIPYHNNPKIRLCPNSKLTIEQGGTNPFNAWDVSVTNPTSFSYIREPLYKIGSYGINWWINDSDLVNGEHDSANKWRYIGHKNSSNIPVLMDCGFMLVRPEPVDPPPQNDGEFLWKYGGGMRRVCTSRHDGNINILFMDWSIGKVGVKELWTLKWHKDFDTANEMTLAGGVEPEDWPEWMRKYKDY